MSVEIPGRYNWLIGQFSKNILEDRDEMVRVISTDLFNRCLEFFKYENLPETITQRDLEIIILGSGSATLTQVKTTPPANETRKFEPGLYAFRAGLGGKPTPYYLPSIAIIANPALNFNKDLIIDEECVVIPNNKLYTSIIPLIQLYSNMIVDGLITLKYAIINNRIPRIVAANDDATHDSVKELFKKIYEGKDFGIALTSDFVDGLNSLNTFEYTGSTRGSIIEVIEYIQYMRGLFFQEIGLSSAFNMKREAINEGEARINDDILFPTIDNMLECRKNGIEKFNKMYGQNVKVELNSIWERIHREGELEEKMLEKEAESDPNANQQGFGQDPKSNSPDPSTNKPDSKPNQPTNTKKKKDETNAK